MREDTGKGGKEGRKERRRGEERFCHSFWNLCDLNVYLLLKWNILMERNKKV